MKYTFHKKEGSKRIVEVEVPFKEIEQTEGEDFTKACSKKVQEIAKEIIQESTEEVIGSPKVRILQQEEKKPLKFEMEFYVLPEIALPDYRKIAKTVKRRKMKVEEKEVEETLRWIQKSRAKFSQKEGPCGKKDLVQIVYSTPKLNQGKEIRDQFILGEGYLIQEFEKELEGMKAGEEKEIEVFIPQNHFWQEIAGQRVTFKVKVVGVQKVELPEINDEWARTLGNFKDLANLKESIKEGILQEKEEIESQRVQNEILEKIASQTEIEIPDILIEIETQHTLQEMKERIPQMFSISFEEYLKRTGLSEEQLKENLLPEIKKKIKKYLVLREIRKKEQIKVSEEEIKEEANKFLARFKTPEEAEKVIDPQSLISYTKEKLENQKTLKFLEGLAEIG